MDSLQGVLSVLGSIHSFFLLFIFLHSFVHTPGPLTLSDRARRCGNSYLYLERDPHKEILIQCDCYSNRTNMRKKMVRRTEICSRCSRTMERCYRESQWLPNATSQFHVCESQVFIGQNKENKDYIFKVTFNFSSKKCL